MRGGMLPSPKPLESGARGLQPEYMDSLEWEAPSLALEGGKRRQSLALQGILQGRAEPHSPGAG